MQRYFRMATVLSLFIAAGILVGCGGTSMTPTQHTANDGGKTRAHPGEAPTAGSKKAPPRLDD
jgi:hypothetical protein